MIIYVCSQLRGIPPFTQIKYRRNLKKAAEYCSAVTAEGHTPIAPHLYFSEFIDDQDPQQRKTGMRMGMELLELCDEVWVFGSEEGISTGMKSEIEYAGKINKPVRYK